MCTNNDVILQAFHEYSPHMANRIYLTLQQVWKEAMKVHGSNNYKLPHMKKGTLERLGLLPIQVQCEETIVNEAIEKLAAWSS